jgi:hypothetical protein
MSKARAQTKKLTIRVTLDRRRGRPVNGKEAARRPPTGLPMDPADAVDLGAPWARKQVHRACLPNWDMVRKKSPVL